MKFLNLLSINISCVSLLLKNLTSSKIKSDPALKEEYEKKKAENKDENIFDKLQYGIDPIKKNSTVYLRN